MRLPHPHKHHQVRLNASNVESAQRVCDTHMANTGTGEPHFGQPFASDGVDAPRVAERNSTGLVWGQESRFQPKRLRRLRQSLWGGANRIDRRASVQVGIESELHQILSTAGFTKTPTQVGCCRKAPRIDILREPGLPKLKHQGCFIVDGLKTSFRECTSN